MQITSYHYVPFLSTTLINDPEEIARYKEITEEYIEDHPDEWGATWAKECGTWNSHDFAKNILFDDKRLENLTERISECVGQYATEMGIKLDKVDLELHESWLNAAKPNHFQECHEHGHSYISGVYYVHTPKNSGDFVMENPLSFEWNFDAHDDSPYGERTYIEPYDGQLILFPSNISHHVTKNLSEEMRYSLAFNVQTSDLASN